MSGSGEVQQKKEKDYQWRSGVKLKWKSLILRDVREGSCVTAEVAVGTEASTDTERPQVLK